MVNPGSRDKIPRRRRWALWSLAACLPLFAFVFLFLPPVKSYYETPYRLSILQGQQPLWIIDTPRRFVYAFEIDGDQTVASKKIEADIAAAGLRWSRQDIIFDGGNCTYFQPMGALDLAGSERVSISRAVDEIGRNRSPHRIHIELVSPIYHPSRFEQWRYAFRKFLHSR